MIMMIIFFIMIPINVCTFVWFMGSMSQNECDIMLIHELLEELFENKNVFGILYVVIFLIIVFPTIILSTAIITIISLFKFLYNLGVKK